MVPPASCCGPTRPDGPCDPRAPVQSLWVAGLGVPLRSPGLPCALGRFDDPPERWPLLAVRVVRSSTDERVSEGSCHRSHTGSSEVVQMDPASHTRIVEMI